MQKFDIIILGSGMAGLSAAALLANDGLKVAVIEQNYLAGGCTSAYWRKGFVFESGATTLVGLDQDMPLAFLLEKLNLKLHATRLEVPMKVYLKDNAEVIRHQNLQDWIKEAQQKFGEKGQKEFWELCYRISGFVWKNSLRQLRFPPSSWSDVFYAMRQVSGQQLKNLPYAFMSMQNIVEKFELHNNTTFLDFLNEQLLITAQNHLAEVNALFGATALCYTNYGNYYMNGGLINLINPIIDFIEKKEGKIFLRHQAQHITKQENKYQVQCKFKQEFPCFESDFLISGIPINNTLPLFGEQHWTKKYKNKVMSSEKLNSAFQMGIAFRPKRQYDCIHYQIHVPKMPIIGSNSIFLSLNHPSDHSRSEQENIMVASVSTHVPNPEKNMNFDKSILENIIIERLHQLQLIDKNEIVYTHSSSPQAWEKWTGRAFGFVGGYPQYFNIKPWQMLDARLDHQKAYICGDTVYPGQGITGVVLSGIIAYEKLKADHF